MSTILVVGLAGLVATACSSSQQSTPIQAVVAQGEKPADGLGPGDPIRAVSVRLYQGDTLALEEALDDGGLASISPAPGSYTVQISRTSEEPGCFWGNTIYDVVFPASTVSVDVFLVCSGR